MLTGNKEATKSDLGQANAHSIFVMISTRLNKDNAEILSRLRLTQALYKEAVTKSPSFVTQYNNLSAKNQLPYLQNAQHYNKKAATNIANRFHTIRLSSEKLSELAKTNPVAFHHHSLETRSLDTIQAALLEEAVLLQNMIHQTTPLASKSVEQT